jgi:cytochrome oxidase Cu insertion factor (SCO1/SenC/PrrC family)
MQMLQRIAISGALFALLLSAAAAQSPAQSPQRRDGDLKLGDVAPDFTIQDVSGEKSVKLSELKDKPVVLLFGSCT